VLNQGGVVKQHKILLLDGIPHMFIGVALHRALKQHFPDTGYVSGNDFKGKSLYKLRKNFSKLIQKQGTFSLPKPALSQIKEKIEQIRPTIIIVIGFSYHLISREDLLMLKNQLGFQLVLWDTDSANFGHKDRAKDLITQEFSRYDHIFSIAKSVVQYVRQLNMAPCDYLHYGGDFALPTRDVTRRQKTIDVCFVGGVDLRRLIWLSGLKHAPMCVVGRIWKKVEPILPPHLKEACTYRDINGQELIDILARSKISLNFLGTYFASIGSGGPLRIFEHIGLKAFVLTESIPEMCELFESGKEIETFTNQEELQDKVAFYLKHDKAREKIALEGYKKIMRCYTWEQQAEKMLQYLNVSY